jgi:copper(I)-binding protein
MIAARRPLLLLLAAMSAAATLSAADGPTAGSAATPTANATPTSAAATPAIAATVSAIRAWSRATTATAQTGVVYLTLVNGGDHDVQLTAATSRACNHVEIHENACCAGGEMSMHEVAALTVPAHGQLVLKPGGYHLMLIALTHGLAQGDELPVTLTVGGMAIAATAAVRPPGALGPTD